MCHGHQDGFLVGRNDALPRLKVTGVRLKKNLVLTCLRRRRESSSRCRQREEEKESKRDGEEGREGKGRERRG